MFVEMREPMDEFTENFDSLILGKISPFLDVVVQVSSIAVFHDEVEVVGGFLHVVESDDVSVLAAFKHFNLAFQ